MKTTILLLLSQLILLSCNSPSDENGVHTLEASTTKTQTETPVEDAPIYPMKENEEYLEWGSVLINGKFPLMTSIKNIESVLGKADSVVSIDWANTCSSSYNGEDSKDAYYGSVEFEQFGDSLNFHTVNFSKDHSVFLQSGDLILNHATTLKELEKHFPKAVQDVSKAFYRIDGVETDAINLAPSKELSDGQWILMFQNGKLIRIDNWFPC